MGKVNIPPLQISFCRSTSKNYKQALQIILSHRSYYLDEGDEKTIVIPPVWPASKAEVFSGDYR